MVSYCDYVDMSVMANDFSKAMIICDFGLKNDCDDVMIENYDENGANFYNVLMMSDGADYHHPLHDMCHHRSIRIVTMRTTMSQIQILAIWTLNE